MLKLSPEEMISKISNREHFEAYLTDGSFYIRIEEYVPYVCFALHNGHRLRTDLEPCCLLNDFERWYEEDPHTLDFIYSLPIVLAGMDSRYEYDLNKAPEEAIYTIAWGKQVWKKTLSQQQQKKSLDKHAAFYRVVNALFEQLTSEFNSVIGFDIHAYNYVRLERSVPLFNLGTEGLGTDNFKEYIRFYADELKKIILPNVDIVVAENKVFFGHGYLLKYIREHFPHSLILATEIKKVYCNEETGEIYPIIIEKLSHQMKSVIVDTVSFHAASDRYLRKRNRPKLLSSEIDSTVTELDSQLFRLAGEFEILKYVNPVNIEHAKKDFFRSKFRVAPVFRYSQLSLNPFEFKRRLYALPIEKIRDVSLRLLYQDVIDSYADKIDIISSIGTPGFLYNSLRYFGEPDEKDLSNARYLLQCSTVPDGTEEMNLTPEDVKNYFTDVVNAYGFQCRIEISRQIVSKVLILNSKKTIKIRRNARFSEKSLRALSEHEVGVHMLTTINSRLQPVKLFRIGLPRNTHTQEGLAILSEYLSGNISINRLQVLALRVLAIDMMIRGKSFARTFEYLMDTGKMNEEEAFFLTARIFRGGGFTKDYLYLTGFRDILKIYNDNGDLRNLLIGKTSVGYLDVINEMIDRGIFMPPTYQTKSLITPVKPQPVIKYVLDGLI